MKFQDPILEKDSKRSKTARPRTEKREKERERGEVSRARQARAERKVELPWEIGPGALLKKAVAYERRQAITRRPLALQVNGGCPETGKG